MVGFGVFVFVEEIGCFRQINKAVWKHIGILNFSTISLNEGKDPFFIRFFKISDLEHLWWKPVMFDQ